jgi:hypothetical protein
MVNVLSDAYSGQPSTLAYVEVRELINQHVCDNWRISVDEIQSEISITHRKVQDWLKVLLKHFNNNGIKKLLDFQTKCLRTGHICRKCGMNNWHVPFFLLPVFVNTNYQTSGLCISGVRTTPISEVRMSFMLLFAARK